MNKDQLKGSAKQAAGKMQSGVGKATGSVEQRAKGALKQAEGRAQKAFGDAREEMDAADDARAERRDRH